MTGDQVADLDDVAARALASIMLERTAEAVRDDAVHAADALTALESDSGLPGDVCAAILYVTSWFAGAGGIDPEAIFAASLAFGPDDTAGDTADAASP